MHRFFTIACAAATVAGQSLTSVLSDTSDLSDFTKYVQAAGLVDTLTSMENSTIFAPTNEAFEEILDAYPNLFSNSTNDDDADNDDSDSDTVNISEAFMNILLYHVVPDVGLFPNGIKPYPGSFLPTSYNGIVVNPFASGEEGIKVFSADKRLSESVASGIEFDSGIIYIVDKVLLPPDGPALTALDMGFEYFYGALQQTDLVTDLNTSSSITVFIPRDQAFIDVGSAIKDLDQSSLSSMMKYHIVPETYYTTNFSDGDSLNTLAEEAYETDLSVTVDENDGALYISNARVITPNILLRNGVAHLIDQVLNVEENDEDYEYAYDLSDGDGAGVPGFEDAASATIPALTSGIPDVTSTFSPTATFSQVSGAVSNIAANPVTYVGMLYAVLMAAA